MKLQTKLDLNFFAKALLLGCGLFFVSAVQAQSWQNQVLDDLIVDLVEHGKAEIKNPELLGAKGESGESIQSSEEFSESLEQVVDQLYGSNRVGEVPTEGQSRLLLDSNPARVGEVRVPSNLKFPSRKPASATPSH